MVEVKGSQGQAVTNENPREELSGWRLHPRASRVLLALLVLGQAAGALLPKSWELLHTAGFEVSVFCAGMLAARAAAIWQRNAG
jgi:hypothetical protein